MRQCEFSRNIVKGPVDALARIPFAHHWLQQHHLDENPICVRLGVGRPKRFDVIHWSGDQVFIRRVGSQVLFIGFNTRVRRLGWTIGSTVEGSDQGQDFYGLVGMSSTVGGVIQCIHIGDAEGDRDTFGT